MPISQLFKLAFFALAGAGCAVEAAPTDGATSAGEAIVRRTCDPGYAPSCVVVKGKNVCTCEPIDLPTFTSCLDVPADFTATPALGSNTGASYVHGAVCDARVAELPAADKLKLAGVSADRAVLLAASDRAACERIHLVVSAYGLAADGWHTVWPEVTRDAWFVPGTPGSCQMSPVAVGSDPGPEPSFAGYTTIRLVGKAYQTNDDGSKTPLSVTMTAGYVP